MYCAGFSCQILFVILFVVIVTFFEITADITDFLFFSNSLSLARNSGGFARVRHSSRKSSATHSCQCVQYFRVSKQWYGCRSLGFLTCAQMSMHAIGNTVAVRTRKRVCTESRLQALVYNILPSTTAVFSYVIGSRKLSANEQFFVGAQTVVGLLQTTQIISDVCCTLPCCLCQLR